MKGASLLLMPNRVSNYKQVYKGIGTMSFFQYQIRHCMQCMRLKIDIFSFDMIFC